MVNINTSRIALACTAFLILTAGIAVADDVISDDFESYESGTGIVGQGGWEAWDRTGIDAQVVEDEAASGDQSLRLQPDTDVVQVLRGIDSGQWVFSAQTYIPGDMVGTAWLILLNTYTHGGAKNWSCNIGINAFDATFAGGSDLPAGGSQPTITDEWIPVRVEINLDTSEQAIFYNGELVDRQPWHATGRDEIQCIDLYSSDGASFYYDDISLQPCVDVHVSPRQGAGPLEVSFEVGELVCGNGEAEAYSWDFGDGSMGTGAQVTHTYTEPGVYEAKVVVTDSDDNRYEVADLISVNCDEEDVPGWTSTEVGEPFWLGCQRPTDGCVEVRGGGHGLARLGDAFRYVHQRVSGDFTATTRISAADWEDGAAAGLMVRTSLDPQDPLVLVAATATEDGIVPVVTRRSIAGRTPSRRIRGTALTLPNIHLRLDRIGEDFIAYTSSDGDEWTEERSTSINDAPADMLLGLAVHAESESGMASATFCDTSFDAAPPATATFRRSDADDNGNIALTDGIFILQFLFAGGTQPSCLETADVNDDGEIGLTDGVVVLQFLFTGGAPPAAPGPTDCGADPADSPSLSCDAYTSC